MQALSLMRLECLRLGEDVSLMIPINSAAGVLVFLVGFALTVSIAVGLRSYFLYERCLNILGCAYKWLKQSKEHEHEINAREGTD